MQNVAARVCCRKKAQTSARSVVESSRNFVCTQFEGNKIFDINETNAFFLCAELLYFVNYY